MRMIGQNQRFPLQSLSDCETAQALEVGKPFYFCERKEASLADLKII